MGAAEAVIRTAFLLPLLLPLAATALAAPTAAPDGFFDDFERGLCLGECVGWNWASSQQIDGTLAVIPGRGGHVLAAQTQARGARVPKAALIARPAKLAPGAVARMSFDMMIPDGTPLNSIHLADLECASCGEAGNPGIRLYLRHGRLRIDRSKIEERNAWTNDAAPQLVAGRWHRIDFEVAVGFAEAGYARVRLDGTEVLAARGDTIASPVGGAAAGADRVQIGLTASSNPVPARAYFDNVRLSVRRAR